MGVGDALALLSLAALAVPMLFTLAYSIAAERAVCRVRASQGCRVDVVVPVYNEPLEAVERTVRSVARWANRVFVVWDGALPAGAPERLSAAAPGKLELIARGRRLGKASALNEAARRSSADYLFVIDAGDVFEGDYRVLCGCCSVVTEWVPEATGPGIREAIALALYHLARSVYRGRCALGKPVVFLGTGSSVSRWVLARLGGFRGDVVLEDVEFGFRLASSSCRPCYTSEARTRVSVPPSYAALRLQQQRWIRGVGQLLARGLWREPWQLLYLLQYPLAIAWHPLLILAALAGVSERIGFAYLGVALLLLLLNGHSYTLTAAEMGYRGGKSVRLAGAAAALGMVLTPALLLALLQGLLGSSEWGPTTPRSRGGGVPSLAAEVAYAAVSVFAAALSPAPIALLLLAYPAALAYLLVRFGGELA